MSRVLLIATVALTVLFLAIGTLSAGGSGNGTPKTPEGAVRAMFSSVASQKLESGVLVRREHQQHRSQQLHRRS